MSKKGVITLIGGLLTLSGIGMFCFGVAMFAYNGPLLSNFMSEVGKYSFFFWLPVLLVGFVVFVVGLRVKKNIFTPKV